MLQKIVNKSLEGDETIIRKIKIETLEESSIYYRKELINPDINDWYYFENLKFFIIREGT